MKLAVLVYLQQDYSRCRPLQREHSRCGR